MNKIVRLLTMSAFAAISFAQVRTLECVMSPSKETPAVTATANGTCRIEVILNKSADGVESGYVDFHISAWLARAEKFTGLHIHKGAEGVAGPVVVNSGLRGTVDGTAGSQTLFYQVPVTSAEGLATLREIMADPAAFYANLHTESSPSGFIRGQLQNTAEWHSRMAAPTINRLETLIRQVAFRLGISLTN